MYKRYIKRLLDIIISALGLFVLSPLILVVALLVRVKLGAPVIFVQKRPGKNEKIFNLYKFRSMSNATDGNGNLLSDEERLGKFGSFLRRLSLDELPQLWNILKGDMSVIGPRPLLVCYLELYNDEQHRRHEVKPGLFGLAGVNGRNAQTWESKFKYDIEYVEHVSFRMDVMIFLKCIKTILYRQGINEEGEATVKPFTGTEKTK